MKSPLFLLLLLILTSMELFAQTPIVDAGPDQELCGGTSPCVILTSTVSGASGPFTYSWQPVQGLNSDTTSNPCARPFTTTTYWVTATSLSTGLTSAPDSVTVTVHPLPTIDAGSDVQICWGDSIQLDGNASGDPNATSYTFQWSPLSNISDPNTEDPWVSPTQTTTYYLDVMSNFGCFGPRDSVQVDVLQGAGTAWLSGGIDSLYVETANSNLDPSAFYLWRQDGTPINGWNNPFVIPDTGSCYFVDVALPQCRERTDTVCAKPVGISPEQPFESVKLYPNPSPGELILEIDLKTPQPLTVSLFSSTGTKVQEFSFQNSKIGMNKFRLTSSDRLSNGLYQIVIKGKVGQYIHPVILQR